MEDKKTNIGKVLDRRLEQEMEESYLDYAMSVIVARALPDVRDGLKPVHRRVLYSMWDMGLTSKAKYRKSATVVGDVLGKYHPHGDLAVYDSLVRMAQPFAVNHVLVDGQGNFGSLDGDTPAAMRYTECRMSPISEEILFGIEKNTVNFIDNYDGTRQEPKVLPAKLPNLIINGTMGIAVGMATNIPPHNLGEVIDATIHLIDHPEDEVEELMQFIQGPDFPTGANIYDISEIRNAYSTGKGKIIMRAESKIEEGTRGSFRIIVTEIPYQVNKASMIEQIAHLVKTKKIIGIGDLRDESDKSGVRVVIELKKDAFPKKILNQLYQYSMMQTAFHVNMLALVAGIQPKVLTLKNILNYYIKHRQEVIRRRTGFDLEVAKSRAHILEGLLKALSVIDQVIETIKKSASRDQAARKLIAKFELSSKQAEAILEMRLAQLAQLEQKKLEQEYKDLKRKIKILEEILADPGKILKIIKEELTKLKEKYGRPRLTRVFKTAIGKFEQEDLIPNEQVIIILTQGNYIKRIPINTYGSQRRGGKGVLGITTKEEDLVEHILQANTHDDVLYFTNRGRVFKSKVYEIIAGSRKSKGQAIVNMLQLGPEERVSSLINISQKNNARYLIMATKKGLVKKIPLSVFAKLRRSGLLAIKLRAQDELCWVKTSTGEDQVLLVSQNGMSIRFEERNFRPMGRTASGVRGIRLRPEDVLVGMDIVAKKANIEADASILGQKQISVQSNLMIVTENGKGKKTPLKAYPIQHRGGIGLRTARLTSKTGKIIRSMVIEDDLVDLIIISKKGQVIRVPMSSVKKLGRATSGVTLMKLNTGDKVASITILEKEIEENNVPYVKNEPQKIDAKNKKFSKSEPKPKKRFFKKSQDKTKSKKIFKQKKPKKSQAKKQAKTTESYKKQSQKTGIKKKEEIAIRKIKLSFDKGGGINKQEEQKKPESQDVKDEKKEKEPNYWGADFWKKKNIK